MRISDWSSDVCSSDLLRQEYIAVAVEGEAGASVNPKAFSDWLLQPADSVTPQLEADARNAARVVVDAAMDAMLAQRASGNLHPESREWLTAAWCATPAGAQLGTAPRREPEEQN